MAFQYPYLLPGYEHAKVLYRPLQFLIQRNSMGSVPLFNHSHPLFPTCHIIINQIIKKNKGQFLHSPDIKKQQIYASNVRFFAGFSDKSRKNQKSFFINFSELTDICSLFAFFPLLCRRSGERLFIVCRGRPAVFRGRLF